MGREPTVVWRAQGLAATQASVAETNRREASDDFPEAVKKLSMSLLCSV